MGKVDYYPLEQSAGEQYNPTFDPGYWLEDQTLIEGMPAMVASFGSFDGIQGYTERYRNSSKLTQVKRVAELAVGTEMVANDLTPFSLVHSIYEAACIRWRTDKSKAAGGSQFSACEWPTGFGVRSTGRGYDAIYVRRTALHIILPHKNENLAEGTTLLQDFTDGAFVGRDTFTIYPENNFDVTSKPGLYFGAHNFRSWFIGASYQKQENHSGSIRVPKAQSFLRILESSVYEPRAIVQTPRPKHDKKALVPKLLIVPVDIRE